MSGADDLPSDLREELVVLRDGVEGLLLDRHAGTPLAEAHAALSRLLGRRASDESLVVDFDATKDALSGAFRSLDPALRERDGPVYEEALRILTSLRPRVVDCVARVPAGDGGGPFPFRASVGTPALHEAPVVPAARIIETPRPWDADPIDGDAKLPVSEPTPVEQDLARLGRDALEDIGILGNLRRLYDHEPWSDARGFEERLLTNLDALWSLDRPEPDELPKLDVPTAAWRYATEWTVPDWGRAFALAFSLSCARSHAALRWVVLGLRRAPVSTLSAFVDGLALASSPQVEPAILEVMRDATEAVIEAALEVAFRRRVFSIGPIAPLLAHPSEAVVTRAIRCIRHAPPERARDLLAAPAADLRPAVKLAALRELAAHGDVRVRAELRAIVDAAPASDAAAPEAVAALELLALIGDPADHDRVLRAALAFPGSAHLLGFYGAPAHLAPLVRALDVARTSGAVDQAGLARLMSAVRRMAGVDPTMPADRVLVAANQALGAAPPGRVRFARAYRRELVIDELRHGATPQADRRLLALELALGWPALPRLDVDDWVARQEANLAALAAMSTP